MKTQFLHVRAYHNGMLQPKGGFTVAYTQGEYPDELYVSIAQCSAKDPYTKRIGRDIVLGRMSVGHIEVFKSLDFPEFIQALQQRVCSGNKKLRPKFDMSFFHDRFIRRLSTPPAEVPHQLSHQE